MIDQLIGIRDFGEDFLNAFANKCSNLPGNPTCPLAASARKDEDLSGIHSELDSESSKGAVTGFRLPPEW